MKNIPIPLTPAGDIDLSVLRDAPRAPVPVLDTAAIMAAVRAEAAARPLTAPRPSRAAQSLSAIAAAVAIAWSALTILHAPAAADNNIHAAWLQNVSPAALETALTTDADDAPYELASAR